MQNAETPPFAMTQRVYIEDTDAGGIVYYVNYMKFMERARTELLRSKGFPKPAIPEQGLLLVVAHAEVSYLRPARLDDNLHVTAKIIKLARTFMVFEQKIFRDEECLTASCVKVACVTRDTMRPSPIPEAVRAALAET